MIRGRSWKMKLCVTAAVLLSAPALAAWEALREKPALGQPDAPLRNYGLAWAHELSHSGTPKNDSGWQWLRSQEVKAIVTFRTENDVDYSKFGFEHVPGIPLRGNLPTDQQGEEFLRFTQDPKIQPVHFHCTVGEDCTGMMGRWRGIRLTPGPCSGPVRMRGYTAALTIILRNAWPGSTTGLRDTNPGVTGSNGEKACGLCT